MNGPVDVLHDANGSPVYSDEWRMVPDMSQCVTLTALVSWNRDSHWLQHPMWRDGVYATPGALWHVAGTLARMTTVPTFVIGSPRKDVEPLVFGISTCEVDQAPTDRVLLLQRYAGAAIRPRWPRLHRTSVALRRHSDDKSGGVEAWQLSSNPGGMAIVQQEVAWMLVPPPQKGAAAAIGTGFDRLSDMLDQLTESLLQMTEASEQADAMANELRYVLEDYDTLMSAGFKPTRSPKREERVRRARRLNRDWRFNR